MVCIDEPAIYNRALTDFGNPGDLQRWQRRQVQPLCTPATAKYGELVAGRWGAPIDIQGSNNGTPLNGATFASGKVGQAFSFDGVNDYVRGAG